MTLRASLHMHRARMLIPGGVLLLLLPFLPPVARAQQFDFDGAPIHTSLPIDLTVDGVTAHFSATGQGFSIQPANTMGFTPAGFGGLCLYPNSVFAADLHIGFSVSVTDFSILYAPQELGCDDSAILRVTAYRDAFPVVSMTATAPQPGTWPTGTLACSDPGGFNAVVVHYDRRPACTDYGPIFMADLMTLSGAVTAVPMAQSRESGAAPNPFHGSTEILFTVPRAGPVRATVHDPAGRLVRTLPVATMYPGVGRLAWDGRDDAGVLVGSGVYFCRILAAADARVTRMVVRR